jgi:hypothetical protein
VRELFFILIYYYVEEKEIPIEYLEKIILRFAVFFSLIYIISVVIYPTAIVRAILSSEDRGTIRMRLEGSGFMMLGYFLVVNRYFVNKKLINAALSFFFLFVLFLHGFRTFIAVAALLTMILYFKLNNVNAKNILVLLLGFITLLLFAQIPIIARIIDKFSSVTESDASSGGDYIRLQEFDFYAYHFSSGWYSYIFGNGMPRGDNDYTAFYTRITENRKLFFVDLGLFGFYIIYGVMATYALIKYVISVIMAKTNLAYRYLNYYFGYLLLVSITTLELYRSGMFGVEALVLYMSVKAVEIAKNQV